MQKDCLARLFAESRRDHAIEILHPGIMNGTVILCDRYLPSSFAYQAAGSRWSDPMPELIRRLNAGAPLPTMTIVFTVAPETAAQRVGIRKGPGDVFDNGTIAAIAERCAVYAGLEEYGDVGPVTRIDAEGSADQVQGNLRSVLDPIVFGTKGGM